MITFNSTIKLPPAPYSLSIIQQYKCTRPGLLSRTHRHIMFGRHKNKCVRVNKLAWCRMLKLIPFSLRFHGISLPTWCTKMHYEVKKPKKLKDFPGGVVKNLPTNSGDARSKGLILGSERSPGERNGKPLQYSCLENSTDRGAWWAIVHEVSKSQTWLSTHTTTAIN